MSISPSYEYLLVMPSGDIKGFNDLDEAKGYINIYYNNMVKNSNMINEFNDITDTGEQFIETVCQNLGVIEGECKVYNTVDVIERIQKTLVFEDEKSEIISKLLSSDINLNIYKYGVDDIFSNIQYLDVMENYG